MKCSFTNSHYEYICKIISNSLYKSIFFNEEYDEKEKVLLLRHDIDQSLENSLALAKIEKNYGIKSTYFIWLTSPFYNIFEKKYSKIIYEIMSLGHQIGLHFDEKVYNIKDMDDLNYHISMEAELIERYFQIKIHAISMHKPSEKIIGGDIKLKDYINTYSKRYLSDFKYISDSRMEWREDCVCKTIKKNENNKLHVLIHPLSWSCENITLDRKIIQFIIYKMKKMDYDLSENISVYKRLF